MQPSTLIPKQVGNMYTASLYAAFASLVHNKNTSLVSFSAHKYMLCLFSLCSELHLCSYGLYFNVKVGKRVVLFSYGSGLTATMFSLRLQEGQHPFNLSNIVTVMNVSDKLKQRLEVCSFLPLISYRVFNRFYVLNGVPDRHI